MTPEFEARNVVNGSILKQFQGQPISIMVCVEDVTATTLIAKTTDEHKLRVSLPMELGARAGEWVEVIGIPSGADAIRAKEVIEFSGEKVDFDTEGYNGAVEMLSNLKTIYRYG